jgi:hypothetical protein
MPEDSFEIICELTTAVLALQAQGRLGYEGDRFRAIGTATGGGQWDLLTGDVSLFGSWSLVGQYRRTRGAQWRGFEFGDSGEISLPFSLPAIAGGGFSIPLPKSCGCMTDDIDGSGFLASLFR